MGVEEPYFFSDVRSWNNHVQIFIKNKRLRIWLYDVVCNGNTNPGTTHGFRDNAACFSPDEILNRGGVGHESGAAASALANGRGVLIGLRVALRSEVVEQAVLVEVGLVLEQSLSSLGTHWFQGLGNGALSIWSRNARPLLREIHSYTWTHCCAINFKPRARKILNVTQKNGSHLWILQDSVR